MKKLPFFTEPRLVYLTLVKDGEILRFQTIAHGLQEALKNIDNHHGWTTKEDSDVTLNAWLSRTIPDGTDGILVGGGNFIPSERDKDYPEARKAIKTWEEVS
tara:strand:- start:233 stop:538 length:306 start_codon:yes stop_codon:yes gene_type:complete